MGLFHRVNDARQGGVVGRRGHFIFQGTGLVDGAGEDFIAHGLFNRQAFTGDRRLVDGGLAGSDFTVQADAFAGLNPHDGTHFYAFDLFFNPRAVSLLHGGLLGCHLHQAADGITRAIQGFGFDQLGDSKQEHHHRGFRPLANQDRAGHRDTHQGIDVQVEVFQGNPALFVRGEAAAEDRHQRHHRDHPGGRGVSEVQHFGSQRADAGQRQRPPVFLGGRLSGRRAFFDGIGLHAEGFDRVDDRRSARQVMGDAEDAVDQVEFQLLHARKLAQFVLDQRLLGGAVHGFDAKGAQPRTGGGRFAQLHQRRGRRAGTAGAAVAVVMHGGQFLRAMIVIVVMFVRGVDGIAHSVASVEVPVAK